MGSEAWWQGLHIQRGEGVQRGGRQGDWEDFGEGLHRWQGEAETAKAGWGGLCTGRARHWSREGLHLVRNDFLRWRSGGSLFRWWFRMKCSKSKFTVASVPY